MMYSNPCNNSNTGVVLCVGKTGTAVHYTPTLDLEPEPPVT